MRGLWRAITAASRARVAAASYGGSSTPRAAKLEPFSRCRSETTSRRCVSQQSAPEMSATSATPATSKSAARNDPSSLNGCARVTVAPIPLFHRFPDEFVGGLRQQLVSRLAINRLAADFQHHGHRERRHVIEVPMGDSSLDSAEHITQSLEVEQAGCGIGAGGAEQNMIRLVLAQHVVDEIG